MRYALSRLENTLDSVVEYIMDFETRRFPNHKLRLNLSYPELVKPGCVRTTHCGYFGVKFLQSALYMERYSGLNLHQPL